MSHPKILPFKSYLYNPTLVGDLSHVVTPPYDVIHPQMQDELYEKSPYNFIRVDLVKGDDDKRYQEAKSTFEKWIKENILLRDEKPAFYFHHQTFELPNGQKITRKGFFATRRVEDASEGGVKPHEKTLEGPKADRLKLTKATGVNMSPVFSLYSDKEKYIDNLVAPLKKQPPLYDFITDDGQSHQMWRVNDAALNKKISDFLQNQAVFIADGHHRYETSLNFRNEQRQSNPPGDGLEPFNYVLMYLSNRDDEGLVILPIHRALHNLNVSVDEVVKKLEGTFKITKINETNQQILLKQLEEAGFNNHAFMLITKDPKKSYLLEISKQKWQESEVSKGIDSSLRNLDVSVLHRLVFEDLLGISQAAQANEKNIIYWKETTRAINETRAGACEMTFLLNSTRVEDMEMVANAGQKMPQKSTFFYPKILSGLVINPLNLDKKMGF